MYHAGTAIKDGKLVTNGGRVLGVTATANTLPDALKRPMPQTENIHFDKLHKRSDIGAKSAGGDGVTEEIQWYIAFMLRKSPASTVKPKGLLHELVDLVGIRDLTRPAPLNRYDVEGHRQCAVPTGHPTVFSEPPVDVTTTTHCPTPRPCLPLSTCPVSLTSAPTPPASASSC